MFIDVMAFFGQVWDRKRHHMSKKVDADFNDHVDKEKFMSAKVKAQ